MSRRPNIELKQAILKAAFRLMYGNGFKGMSMDDVAKESGIKKANLFHYFPTKEALGVAVFDHAVQGFQKQVSESLTETNEPLAVVAAMFDDALKGMQAKGCAGGCFVGNLALELSDYNENLRGKVADYLSQWCRQLSVYFERQRQLGYFHPEFDPAMAAQAILSLFEGAMLICKATRELNALQSARAMAVSYIHASKT